MTTTTFRIEKRLLEEEVDTRLVKELMCKASWKSFKKQVKRCAEEKEHPCGVCKGHLALHIKAVICDACLKWHHICCTNLKKKTKKHWICTTCLRESNERIVQMS